MWIRCVSLEVLRRYSLMQRHYTTYPHKSSCSETSVEWTLMPVPSMQLSFRWLFFTSHTSANFHANSTSSQTESLGQLSKSDQTYAAIIANPPFIPWDMMSNQLREVVTQRFSERPEKARQTPTKRFYEHQSIRSMTMGICFLYCLNHFCPPVPPKAFAKSLPRLCVSR